MLKASPKIVWNRKFSQIHYAMAIFMALVMGMGSHLIAGETDTLYWRVTAVNSNFNNPANWSITPDGMGPIPGTYPRKETHVVFSHPSNITTIKILDGSHAEMASLTCRTSEGVVYTLEKGPWSAYGSADTYRIYGDILLNGRLNIQNNTKVEFAGNQNTILNLGTPYPYSYFGEYMEIKKENLAGVALMHPLYLPQGSVRINSGSFTSNHHDITLKTFYATGSSSSTDRKADLGNSRLEVTATSEAGMQFYPGQWLLSGCSVICNNPVISFSGFGSGIYAPSTFKIKNLTIKNSAAVTIMTLSYTHIKLETEKLTIDAPNLRIWKNGTDSRLHSVTVSDSLIFVQGTSFTISEDAYGLGSFSVNKVKEPESCAEKVTFYNNSPGTVTFHAASQPLILSRTDFYKINFDDAGQPWVFPSNNDLGLNTGNFILTGAVAGKKYFWIGEDGDWNDPVNWSLQSGGAPLPPGDCVPGNSDTVYVDHHSFSAQGQKIRIRKAASCKEMVWTDYSRTGTIEASNNVQLTIYGNADFSGVSSEGINTTIHFSGSGNHTIISSDTASFGNLYFINTGTYTLLNDMIAGEIRQQGGNFNSNGMKITATSILSEDYQNMSRALNLSGSTIRLLSKGGYSYPDAYCFRVNGTRITSVDFSNTHFITEAMTNPAHNMRFEVSWAQPIQFHNLSFLSKNGKATIYVPHGSVFQKIKLNGSAQLPSVQTDTLLIHPNKTYTLGVGGNYTFTVRNWISTGSSCGGERADVKGNSPVNRTTLNYGNEQRILIGINISDIMVSAQGLLIQGGTVTNCSNISEITYVPKTFYWVGKGDNDNWSNPMNWSIGISGGEPSVTNNEGCVPGTEDDIVFDELSFTANGQRVFLDDSRYAIHSLNWTAEAAAYNPVFASAAIFEMNISGSFEIAEGVVLNFPNARNGTVFKFNAESSVSIKFSNRFSDINAGKPAYIFGPGTFLIGSDIQCSQFIFEQGSLFLNGHDISTNSSNFTLAQAPGKVIDIQNSTLTFPSSGTAKITAIDQSLWFSSGCNLVYVQEINHNFPIQFNTVELNSRASNQLSLQVSDTYPLITKKLHGGIATYSASRLSGYFITDTLQYDNGSSLQHSFIGGTRMVINHKLLHPGTPCGHATLSCDDNTNKATLSAPNCNLDLYFIDLKNIKADITNGCTREQYTVLGRNVDGTCENFTFRSIPPSVTDAPDAIVDCKYPAYIYKPDAGIFNIEKYVWNKDGQPIPGTTDTTSFIPIESIGKYIASVHYAGNACVYNFGYNFIQILDENPPEFTYPGIDTLYTVDGTCQLRIPDESLDPSIYDCNLDHVWYGLSGATQADSIPGTLKDYVFNTGTTYIHVKATDYIPEAYYPEGLEPVPAPNFNSGNYSITILDTSSKFIVHHKTFCGGNTLNLRHLITDIKPGYIPLFYTDSDGNNELTDLQVTPSGTTTYYVKAIDTLLGCESIPFPVHLTWKEGSPPSITVTDPNPVISGSSVELSATVTNHNEATSSLHFYRDASTLHEIPSSVIVYSDTIIYVKAVDNELGGCESDVKEIRITLWENPIIPDENGILYVNHLKDGDGSSWDNALKELADALKYAWAYPDNVDQIWVAAGTYFPKYDYLLSEVAGTQNQRQATFLIPKDIQVRGGFAGWEDSVTQRVETNPLYENSAYETVMSGDIDQLLFPDDYNALNGTIYAGTEGNVYHVVIIDGDIGNTLLDGFTICGGNANNPDENSSAGNIPGNIGGGIVISQNSYPRLHNLKITHNHALSHGGGISMYQTDVGNPSLIPVKLENIVVENNRSQRGAGINAHIKVYEIRNFDISKNTAYRTDSQSNEGWGGGLFSKGYGKFLNGKITDNIAIYGAGLVAHGNDSIPSLQIYSLTNVTFVNNTAIEEYGGLFVEREEASVNTQGAIRNSILWDNTDINGYSNIYFDTPIDHTVQNSLIQGCGNSGTGWNHLSGADRGQNKDVNPLFVGSGPYPYRLIFGSPAIDGGNSSLYIFDGGSSADKDLSGNDRINTVIDMGAYEYHPVTGQYTLWGTVFPFVHDENPDFAALFTIMARLYPVPEGVNDPLDEILNGTALFSDTVTFYDGSLFIANTPANPGQMGLTDNPGIPIQWQLIGKARQEADTACLKEGVLPSSDIGWFNFRDVPAGNYILRLSRDGFINRFAKISVSGDGLLGHRELIPGDVNDDMVIDMYDISTINAKTSVYGSSKYNPRYDFNADGRVNDQDASLILFYVGFALDLYEDTLDWLIEY